MAFTHNLAPVLFEVGPLSVRWYAIMWLLGFLFIYYFVRRQIRNGRFAMQEKELDNLMTLLLVSTIVFARVFYIIFYNFSYYIQNPLEMLAVWHGGLSFHGGLAGMIAAGWWFARKKGMKFLEMADVFVIPAALAQAFGRIGNFINGELYGRVTNVPWAVNFPGAEGPRHPSQLYEAAYDIVIFIILLWLWRKNKVLKQGNYLALFLILYGCFRFLTEFLRQPEIMIGPLTMGQLLNIPIILIGAWMLWKGRK